MDTRKARIRELARKMYIKEATIKFADDEDFNATEAAIDWDTPRIQDWESKRYLQRAEKLVTTMEHPMYSRTVQLVVHVMAKELFLKEYDSGYREQSMVLIRESTENKVQTPLYNKRDAGNTPAFDLAASVWNAMGQFDTLRLKYMDRVHDDAIRYALTSVQALIALENPKDSDDG